MAISTDRRIALGTVPGVCSVKTNFTKLSSGTGFDTLKRVGPV